MKLTSPDFKDLQVHDIIRVQRYETYHVRMWDGDWLIVRTWDRDKRRWVYSGVNEYDWEFWRRTAIVGLDRDLDSDISNLEAALNVISNHANTIRELTARVDTLETFLKKLTLDINDALNRERL